MKLLLTAVGWIASICAGLVGVGLALAVLYEPFLLSASLACFVFSVAVNPLAIRKLRVLGKPLVVFATAAGAVVLGVAGLVAASAHLSAVATHQAEAAKLAEAATQKAAADREATELKQYIVARRPKMDAANYERVRIVSTADLNPTNIESLRKYFTAKFEFEDPNDSPVLIKFRVDSTIRDVSADAALQDALNRTNSATHLERARIFLDQSDDKLTLENQIKKTQK